MNNDTFILDRALMPEEENLRIRLIAAEKAKSDAEIAYYRVQSLCKHPVFVSRLWENRETGTVDCAICGEHMGWWCPSNPNHPYCEYEDHKEGCIYCGDPSERK
jgi:hypothetical protein